jgi:iron complex outermembrane receptor protein
MKLTTFLLIVSIFKIEASNYAQNTKITLDLNNVTIEKVLKEIEMKTEFKFLFSRDDINVNKLVSVKTKNEKVKNILNKIFLDMSVSYELLNKQIIIKNTPKDKEENPTNLLIDQQLEIKGTVTDSNGTPLPGVSILIAGTVRGTQTDFNGKYSIQAEVGEIAEFSFIGMKTERIIIGSETIINVQLEEDLASLDEIVVIGYGSQTKKEVTGAVTGVKAEDFNKGSIISPAQLLQGKVAGLNIVSPQGNPNGAFNIRLRGLSTLGANTQPLIIIDGIIGVDINSVDPNDIASMDVLKDGGAAAIYGTRGSSGVILITTKTGVRGKVKITYDGSFSAENKDRFLPVMNKKEYLSNGGTDYGGETNWLNEVTRTATSQVHNLSLSGGNDQTIYRASINYRDVDGVLLNSGFKQLNGRLNLTQKALDNKLTFTLNLAGTSKEAQLGFEDAFRSSVVMPPSAPIYSSDPYYSKYGGYFQSEVHELYNPLAIVNQNINDQKILRLMYNLRADYKLTENLTASVHYAQNNDTETRGQYISKYSYYGSGVDRNGLATSSSYNIKNELFEATGNYVKSFNLLNFAFLGGYSYQNFTSENFSIQAGNFLTDAFTYNNFSAAKDVADGKALASSLKENNKLIGFFSRMNINYDNTYFLTASIRREGSTRFGKGNQWGNFPGLSGGVDLRRLIEIPKVDQLKVRTSYGITGALPDQSYLSQQLYGPGSSATYFLFNGAFTPVFSPQSNPNPDLKWETKSEVNFGVDFSMFNSRLNGTFDYYIRKTTDALITLEVPVPPNLFPTSVLNAGELRNEGIEANLEYDVVKNKMFGWTTRATFATYNTKIVSLSMGDIQYGVRDVGGLPAPLVGNTVRVEEGNPIGQIIGWIYEGVDSDGNYILKDLNNDNLIDANDIGVIGRGLPKGEFGWSNTFSYGKFDLNVLLRGVYGHDLVNLNRTMFEQISRISSYNLVNTEYFDPTYSGPAAYNSYYLENASFIKLDNFTIGYNFKFPDQSKLTSARAYVSGQNLFYITKYSGVDPEPRYTNNGNVLAPGVEPRNSWVTTRTFTLGINLSF